MSENEDGAKRRKREGRSVSGRRYTSRNELGNLAFPLRTVGSKGQRVCRWVGW